MRATAGQWLVAIAASLLIHLTAASLWARFEPGAPAGASAGWSGDLRIALGEGPDFLAAGGSEVAVKGAATSAPAPPGPEQVAALPEVFPAEPPVQAEASVEPDLSAEMQPLSLPNPDAPAETQIRDLAKLPSETLGSAIEPGLPSVSSAPPGVGSEQNSPGGGTSGESGLGESAPGFGLWKGGGRNTYWARIREGIVQEARYPIRARRRGIEGEVLLLVRVDREGRLQRAEVLGSSGSQLLDREALESLRRAAPFGAIAISIPNSELEFEIPVEFALE